MATQLTNLSLPQLGLPTLDCKIADILATNLEIFASIFSSGQVHHVISSSFVRYLIKSVTNQSGWVASYYCIRRNIFNDYCRACCTDPFVTRRRRRGQMRGHRLEKNRRRIRWNTLRIFLSRERRRWPWIVRRSRNGFVQQALYLHLLLLRRQS